MERIKNATIRVELNVEPLEGKAQRHKASREEHLFKMGENCTQIMLLATCLRDAQLRRWRSGPVPATGKTKTTRRLKQRQSKQAVRTRWKTVAEVFTIPMLASDHGY